MPPAANTASISGVNGCVCVCVRARGSEWVSEKEIFIYKCVRGIEYNSPHISASFYSLTLSHSLYVWVCVFGCLCKCEREQEMITKMLLLNAHKAESCKNNKSHLFLHCLLFVHFNQSSLCYISMTFPFLIAFLLIVWRCSFHKVKSITRK